jgi:hypothetical protein
MQLNIFFNVDVFRGNCEIHEDEDEKEYSLKRRM